VARLEPQIRQTRGPGFPLDALQDDATDVSSSSARTHIHTFDFPIPGGIVAQGATAHRVTIETSHEKPDRRRTQCLNVHQVGALRRIEKRHLGIERVDQTADIWLPGRLERHCDRLPSPVLPDHCHGDSRGRSVDESRLGRLP
jgi:hypothetical protein